MGDGGTRGLGGVGTRESGDEMRRRTPFSPRLRVTASPCLGLFALLDSRVACGAQLQLLTTLQANVFAAAA